MTLPSPGHIHFWLSSALLLIGLYGILASPNLVRKVMGLNILQVAIIVFFLTLAAKTDATFPVIGQDEVAAAAQEYVNPLPHALMLTAIVVGVSTTGVALALVIRIHRHFGTLEEPTLLAMLRQ